MSYHGNEYEPKDSSCDSCLVCCSKFWQSLPYATLALFTTTLVGIIGFLAAGTQGTISLSLVPHFNPAVRYVAPTLGVISFASLLPLTVVFLFAVCATGYIREVTKGQLLTSCLGTSCGVFTLSLILLFALVWVLVCIALAGFVAVYVELSVSCTQLGQNANFTGFQDRMLCIPTYSLFNVTSEDICGGTGLEQLCNQGLTAGIAFGISLCFAFVVTFGWILLLLIQTCNFVKVREVSNYHNTYNLSDS